MKRRHFNPDVAPNKRESLEWMRINAERERIFRFKSIAKDTASQYYTILDRFMQELINPANKDSSRQQSQVRDSAITKEDENKVNEVESVIMTEEPATKPLASSKRAQNFK